MTLSPFFQPRLLTALFVPMAVIAASRARATAHPPSDVAAVQQVEKHWLDAEFHGDTAFLRQMILPEYRSVSYRGVIDRAAILNHAVQHAARNDPEPQVSQTPNVVIHGTIAVATFQRPDTSMSANVFVLEHGSWHAIYSQHTEFKPAEKTVR